MAGYVLLSVLLLLIAITGLVLSATRLSVDSATRTAIAEDRSVSAVATADLVAIAISMENESDAIFVERHEAWVRLQPGAGLIDLNTAHAALIEAVLSAEDAASDEILSRLEADRAGNRAPFRSVSEGLSRLGIDPAKHAILAPHLTVETRLNSVNPDLSAPSLRSELERVLDENAIAPLTDNQGGIFLLLTGPAEQRILTPKLYLSRSILGELRLLALRDGT